MLRIRGPGLRLALRLGSRREIRREQDAVFVAVGREQIIGLAEGLGDRPGDGPRFMTVSLELDLRCDARLAGIAPVEVPSRGQLEEHADARGGGQRHDESGSKLGQLAFEDRLGLRRRRQTREVEGRKGRVLGGPGRPRAGEGDQRGREDREEENEAADRYGEAGEAERAVGMGGARSGPMGPARRTREKTRQIRHAGRDSFWLRSPADRSDGRKPSRSSVVSRIRPLSISFRC